MPKPLSGFVPLTALLTTISAYFLPWWLVEDGFRRGAPADPALLHDTAFLTLLAALSLAYLGGVRRRDLERLENAWSVTTRVGLRPMPGDRLRASAGWGMKTLSEERYWWRALSAAAFGLRWLTAIMGAASLLAAASCLAMMAGGVLVPGLSASLIAAPGWSDVLILALPALLWPAALMHLPRLPQAQAPSDAQIIGAQLDLVGRLTDPKIQAGAAAMSAVDHGLDGVFALAARAAPLLARGAVRPAHDLAGLSDIPSTLIDR